ETRHEPASRPLGILHQEAEAGPLPRHDDRGRAACLGVERTALCSSGTREDGRETDTPASLLRASLRWTCCSAVGAGCGARWLVATHWLPVATCVAAGLAVSA